VRRSRTADAAVQEDLRRADERQERAAGNFVQSFAFGAPGAGVARGPRTAPRATREAGRVLFGWALYSVRFFWRRSSPHISHLRSTTATANPLGIAITKEHTPFSTAFEFRGRTLLLLLLQAAVRPCSMQRPYYLHWGCY
jgi:hypothetical protein